MLEKKKYVFMVEPSKSCQLSFHARWVYSFLVYRVSFGKAASEDCICRNINVCNRAVKKYLHELRDAGLLVEERGRYLASDPGEHWQWFVQKDNSENLPWCERFGSYSVYVPKCGQKLPLMHSALLSLIHSLYKAKKWWHFTTTGLATMMFPAMKADSAKKQVNRAAENLRALGLLDDQWNITLQEEHHHLWRDAEELVNPHVKTDVGYRNSREYVLACLKNHDCRFYKGKAEMSRDLDSHDLAMRSAGYNRKQILDYWEEVMGNPQFCDCQFRFVEMFIKKGFHMAFQVAENITKENRLAGTFSGISLGMLRQKSQQEIRTIKDWDAKRTNPDANGQTYSQLIFYEPDYFQLRRGRKCSHA
jgi:hypothetical protein